MNLAVETEQETDGRWIAEIPQIPGALAYGADRGEAIARVEALALRMKRSPFLPSRNACKTRSTASPSGIRNRVMLGWVTVNGNLC